MKKILAKVYEVFKAYTLEEKVLSLICFVVLLFFGFRGINNAIDPKNTYFQKGVYTEGLISTKSLLLNPLYMDFSQANRDIGSLVFSGLLKYDPKVKGFVDDLAFLKISEDQKEYFLTLKDNLKWQDGEFLTIDDILFTFNLIQDPEFQNLLLKTDFDKVKIEKVDDKTVKFVLEQPNSFFITNLNIGILPKHLLGNIAVKDLLADSFNLKPIGSGPYMVADLSSMGSDGKQKVVLNRNDLYYGVKPTIQQIRFNIYPDEQSLLKDKDSLDIISKISGDLNQLVFDKRFTTNSYTLPQYTAVFFNTNSEKLKELKLRIALVKLIDKDELIKGLHNKLRVDTPLMELNQEEWMNKSDLNEANGALFDAGYKFKKDEQGNVIEGEIYRKDKNGNDLKLILIAKMYENNLEQKEEQEKTVDFLIESWKKGGVKVEVNYLDDVAFAEAINVKNYDMVLAGQSMGYNLDTFPFWHSSQAKEGGLNLSNYKSFAADAQIEKIRLTFDLEDKDNRQKKLADVIAKEVPALFLYRPSYNFLTDGKVKNIDLNGLDFISDRFKNVANWCIGDEC